MTKITMITEPDKLLNDRVSVLLVAPDNDLKTQFNDAMKEIDAEVNLYMWEIGDPDDQSNIQWLVEVARDVDHIILNCDDMYKDRWIVGYLLQLKHCYFKHMGSTEAFGYNVVNNNKIWNLDYLKEHLENLEAQRKNGH